MSETKRGSAGGHWSSGLRKTMNDPKEVLFKDEKIVIIKDKYPKAKHHFLVLPLEDVPNLKALDSSHVGLVGHMEEAAAKFTAKYKGAKFRYGFHAVPSMLHLHMHAISQDFVSPWLKLKKHWNSFTSAFFLDSRDVIKCLREKGSVTSFSPEETSKFLKQNLRCHKCSFATATMPKLKSHLECHG